ncbi:MAG: porin [Plesiomonas sp.]|uniref:porin n=1 Tax=Plesiomonas sp. TaxID=2486279 RepID=UPI003F39D6DF
MKRNLLAIVMPALLVSGATQAAVIYDQNNSKVDFYGRAAGLNYMSPNKEQSGDQSYARLGVKAETQINPSLIGIGLFEYNMPTSGETDNELRYAYVGLQHDTYGGLAYGRQDGLMTYVNNYTDVLPEFGGDGLGKKNDSFGTGRTDGLLMYTFKRDGFMGGVQYTTPSTGTIGNNNGTGDGYALALGYETKDTGSGHAGIMLSYTNAKKTTEQTTLNFGGNENAEIMAAGLKYHYKHIHAAITYAEGRNSLKGNSLNEQEGYFQRMRGYEAVIQYQAPIEPSIAYIRTDVKDNALNVNDVYNEYIAIGATIHLNKNFRIYTDYKVNLLNENEFTKANNLNTSNVYGLGVRYDF